MSARACEPKVNEPEKTPEPVSQTKFLARPWNFAKKCSSVCPSPPGTSLNDGFDAYLCVRVRGGGGKRRRAKAYAENSASSDAELSAPNAGLAAPPMNS
jgi:hypothetical protein